MRRPFAERAIDWRPWVIATVVLATFSTAIGNRFVWDDFDFILRNANLHALRNIPGFLLSGDAAGTGLDNPYYRPLTTITFALDHALWGTRPAGYHATNVLLHLLVCLALYRVLRRTTGDDSASLAVALLFSVHPAHSEPVGYISARADLLCALFLLLSFVEVLRVEESGDRRRLLPATAWFSLALFSKIVALAFPILLALRLAVPRKRDRAAGMIAPFVAVSVAFLILRSRVLTMESWGAVPFPVRAANAGPFLLGYLASALVPVNLKVFHDIPLKSGFSDPAVLASWVGVFASGTVAWITARRRPQIAFGIAWFFAGLLPVCGLVTILYPACVADRYLYIPMIGLAFAAASILRDIEASRPPTPLRTVGALFVGGLILASAAGTNLRLGDWHDSLSLWSAAASDAPGSLYVKNGLAAAHMERESFDEAERILKEVIAVRDDSAQPRINLAGIEFRRGNLDKMEIHVNRALELRPSNHVALTYLGVIKARKGWTNEAIVLFQEALRLNPRYDYARENLEIVRRQAPLTRAEANVGADSIAPPAERPPGSDS